MRRHLGPTPIGVCPQSDNERPFRLLESTWTFTSTLAYAACMLILLCEIILWCEILFEVFMTFSLNRLNGSVTTPDPFESDGSGIAVLPGRSTHRRKQCLVAEYQAYVMQLICCRADIVAYLIDYLSSYLEHTTRSASGMTWNAWVMFHHMIQHRPHPMTYATVYLRFCVGHLNTALSQTLVNSPANDYL